MHEARRTESEEEASGDDICNLQGLDRSGTYVGMRATGEDTTGMEITLPREQHTRYNELTGSRATIVKFILKPTRVFGHGTMDDGRACGGRISSLCATSNRL